MINLRVTSNFKDLGKSVRCMISSQKVALGEDIEKVKDSLSKQQLKEAQHKEKTQSLVEKAESFRVRIDNEQSLISVRDKRGSWIHAHVRD